MRLRKTIREAVWTRDGHRCRRCDTVQAHRWSLHVEVVGPQPAEGVDLAGLATICRECRDNVDRAKRRPPSKLREAIFLRDRLICQLCGRACQPHAELYDFEDNVRRPKLKRGVDLTCEAGVLLLTPRAQGGTFDPNNLVTACRTCSSRKVDYALDAYEARLVAVMDWEETRL